ncbi:unnamed protein product, partial [Rotaria magnacalcarata]
TTSSAISDPSTKWQPYWDENYKRYYWSDGNESVWETPEGCVEPPLPESKSSLNVAQQQQYST